MTGRRKEAGRRETGVGSRKSGVERQKLETGSQKHQTPDLKHIAIFASGAGTNAQNIIDYFSSPDSSLLTKRVAVSLIVCNKPNAGVINIAHKENIPVLLIEKERFYNGDAYLAELKESNIDLIVLAGFLWKIPQTLIDAFPKKIINIHPALLPKYGGKDMYGAAVHQAVIDTKEKESGITIHYVDEYYDHGDAILQVKCDVLPDDTAETLAHRIQELEHKHYSEVIEKLLFESPNNF